MVTREEYRLLVEIAYMYYDENMKQIDIAKELNMSRSLVSKHLTTAKEMEIVKFVINDDLFNFHHELEKRIKLKYNLKRVIIVDSNKNKEIQKQRVSQAAGKHLIQQLKKNSTVALAGGTTINKAIASIPASNNYPDTNFISIVGGLNDANRDIQSNSICRKAARKVGGKSTLLYAPVIVDSLEAKEVFINQSFIKDVFKKAEHADLAFLGVGGPPNKNSSIARTYNDMLSTDLSLYTSNIIGDFAYYFINKEGNIVDCKWNNRLISLSLNVLKNIPNVIVVAEGTRKKDCLIALLKNNLIDTLILDENLANQIIKDKG